MRCAPPTKKQQNGVGKDSVNKASKDGIFNERSEVRKLEMKVRSWVRTSPKKK